MTQPVVSVGAVLAVIGALLVGYLLVVPPRAVSRQRRRWRPDDAGNSLGRASTASSDLALRALGSRASSLAERLELAGIRQRPQDFMVVVIAAAVALFVVGWLLGGPPPAVLFALVILPITLAVLSIRTSRRRRAFGLQLDETLQVLSGGLRAGYSLPQAISTAAVETVEPTNQELARVVNEARVGRPLVESLADSARRMKNDDFYWVVQAIAINREVGGNLADVLAAVGETIRERTHLKGHVDALAADGVFSAVILVLLPFAVGGVIALVNPTYIGKLFTNPIGVLMLVVAGVLLIIGALWMRAAVKIKY